MALSVNHLGRRRPALQTALTPAPPYELAPRRAMGPRASLALAVALLLWPPAAAAELSDLAALAPDGDDG